MKLKDKTEENIKYYCAYHNNQIKIISKLQCDDFERTYKKLLLSSLIDSLSRTVYPRKGSRDRFVEFVKNFGDWNDGNKISLPHLIRLTKICPEPEFEKIRELAYDSLKNWAPGEVISLDRDIDYNLALSKYPKDKSLAKNNDEFNLNSIQHFNLLYVYRNSLVHEFRPPSSDFDRGHHNYPFYMHVTKIKTEHNANEVWVLNYPVQFYLELANNCIKNLEKYLLKNRLDPYDYFIFGDYWLEKFNL